MREQETLWSGRAEVEVRSSINRVASVDGDGDGKE